VEFSENIRVGPGFSFIASAGCGVDVSCMAWASYCSYKPPLPLSFFSFAERFINKTPSPSNFSPDH
jgi:hypothetical protein